MQNIELQDMMVILHGLRMSGLSFVEPDALDAINDRIKNLPSSEHLGTTCAGQRGGKAARPPTCGSLMSRVQRWLCSRPE